MSGHQRFDENLESVNQMMQEAQSNPNKRVQFLPIFRNIFSTKQAQQYKAKEELKLKKLVDNIIDKQCSENQQSIRECHDRVKQLFGRGKEYFTKIHKEYKVSIDQDDDE